ncbi:MAG TPA: hypothetical protein PL045_09155 [Chitinophagaceae bacterium]|nr:hypothetical protein [Chitinophagaceae bacterium]
MNDATPEELQSAKQVAFYQKPQDKIPTLITTDIEIEYGDRGKLWARAKGINEYYPMYHFKPWNSTISYGVSVTNPLDELHERLGI